MFYPFDCWCMPSSVCRNDNVALHDAQLIQLTWIGKRRSLIASRRCVYLSVCVFEFQRNSVFLIKFDSLEYLSFRCCYRWWDGERSERFATRRRRKEWRRGRIISLNRRTESRSNHTLDLTSILIYFTSSFLNFSFFQKEGKRSFSSLPKTEFSIALQILVRCWL